MYGSGLSAKTHNLRNSGSNPLIATIIAVKVIIILL